MKKTRIACAALALVFAGLTTAVLAAKPAPPPRPPINCKYVLCAYPDCGDGYHTEIPTGQCCPVCVPN